MGPPPSPGRGTRAVGSAHRRRQPPLTSTAWDSPTRAHIQATKPGRAPHPDDAPAALVDQFPRAAADTDTFARPW